MILGSPNSIHSALSNHGKPSRRSFFGNTKMGWQSPNMGLPMRTGYSAAAPVTGGQGNPMAFPGYNPASGTSPVGQAVDPSGGIDGSQFGAPGLLDKLRAIGVGGAYGPGGNDFFSGGIYG